MTWLVWALLAALFAGVTAVLAKVGTSGIDSNLATAIRTSVIFVLAWAVAFSRTTISLSTIPSKTWVYLCLSGVATGASWLCYFRALQLGPVSKVAPIDKLSVVFAIGLAAFFLDEQLSWKHYAAVALIISGSLLLLDA